MSLFKIVIHSIMTAQKDLPLESLQSESSIKTRQKQETG